jgi:hypothetical protein
VRKLLFSLAVILLLSMTLGACGNGEESIAPTKTPGATTAAGAVEAPVPGNEEIFRYVQDLTSIGYRRTGTPEGKKAAEYVRDRLIEFGISETSIEQAESFSWNADQWDLSVAGQSIPSFAVANSFIPSTGTGPFSTGDSGLTAEVVDIGDGPVGDMDVRGKIVLFNLRFTPLPFSLLLDASEFTYDPGQTFDPNDSITQPYLSNFTSVLGSAIDNGAVGFVGVLADYFDSNKYYNEAYETSVTIPGLWVTGSDGQAMRDALAKTGSGSQATIILKGSYEPATAMTVVGFLPGQSPETILISSHHDSVWDGGVEDASGTAEVLALAKYFAAQPISERNKSLMFVTFDSHFTGYESHKAFIKKYIDNPVENRRIIANVSIEHIAKQVEIVDGRLTLTGLVEPRAIFESVGPVAKQAIQQAITDSDLERTVVLPASLFYVEGECGLPTDASFMDCAGVLVISLISGPVYIYDPVDTSDMVPIDQLGKVAKTFIQIVDRLDTMNADEISGQ